MKTLKINEVASSFVKTNMKISTDKGNGEAKLFVGSMKNEKEYDNFFGFGNGYTYQLEKDNLLTYLREVKMEYKFQTINTYKNANLKVWDENYQKIENSNSRDFFITLIKFTDSKRYYLKPTSNMFPVLRGLIVPKLTDITFKKDEQNKVISMLVEVNYDFKNSTNTIQSNIFKVNFNTTLKSQLPRNRIIFGAPGTGKSYTLNKEKDALLPNDGSFERVTFHPDYSYAQFVGTYKPVPSVDEDGHDIITYEYVPGPFSRTLVEAIKSGKTDDPKPHLLIIEEINRANVAAVFGDVFQLLDRDDDEVSEYPIQTSEDMRKYLAYELGGEPEDFSEIKLPNNMFIWATMNSADQGVFPMDTAFKRRWDFTYIGINDSEEGIATKTVTLGKGTHARKVNWNNLRKAINNELLTYKVNEDKLMGPYFISKKVLGNADEMDTEKFISTFKNKIIMYLFDDAAKQKRASLFAGCTISNLYSEICSEFETKGVSIFCDNIRNAFTDSPSENTLEGE